MIKVINNKQVEITLEKNFIFGEPFQRFVTTGLEIGRTKGSFVINERLVGRWIIKPKLVFKKDKWFEKYYLSQFSLDHRY